MRLTVRALDRDSARQVVLVTCPAQRAGAGVQQRQCRRRGARHPAVAAPHGRQRQLEPELRGHSRRPAHLLRRRGPQHAGHQLQGPGDQRGRSRQPAAYAEAMYERRVYGRSAAGRFNVGAAGQVTLPAGGDVRLGGRPAPPPGWPCCVLRLWPHAPLREQVALSTPLYDRHGSLLRLTLAPDEQYRLWTPLDAIAPSPRCRPPCSTRTAASGGTLA